MSGIDVALVVRHPENQLDISASPEKTRRKVKVPLRSLVETLRGHDLMQVWPCPARLPQEDTR